MNEQEKFTQKEQKSQTKWTDERIEEALIEAGYLRKSITWHPHKPLHLVEETNKNNRQYYRWTQTDSNGNIIWVGTEFQAAKRAGLFSFKAY